MALCALLVPSACAPVRPPAMPPGHAALEAEATAVARSLFAAMERRDTAAIHALFLPGATVTSVVVGEGGATTARARSATDFAASVGRSAEVLRERIARPLVQVDGPLATLWARYDFHLGDRFSHCGTDAFQLARVDGAWRIAALSYTIQRAGCAPLDALP